jgi:hypothetical protein
MTTMYKYFDDVYVEIEVGTSIRGYETVNELSIFQLLPNGKISRTNSLHTIIDFYTNNHLLNLAIEVQETGQEGSDL